MNTNQLAEKIASIEAMLEQTEVHLFHALGNESEAKRQADTAKENYELALAQVVIGEKEKGKDGAMNGRNAEDRKLQLTVFTDKVRRDDPHVKAAWEVFQALSLDADDASAQLKEQVNTFSSLRSLARMYAGLGHAMGR